MEDIFSLKRFFSLIIRDCKFVLTLLVVVVIISSLSVVFGPILFSKLIDQLVDGYHDYLVYGFILYSLIVGYNRASVVLVNNLVKNVEHKAIYYSSVYFFTRITNCGSEFYLKYNPAQLNEILRNAQMALRIYINLFSQVLVPGLIEVIISVSAVSFLINIKVGLIIFTYGLCIIILTILSNNYAKPYQDSALQETHSNSKYFGNVINSVEAIQVNNALKWVIQRFGKGAENARKAWYKFYWVRLGYGLLQALTLSFQISITYYLLLPEFFSNNLTVGEIVLFNMILLQLNRPFELIGTSLEEFMVAGSLLSPLRSVLKEPSGELIEGERLSIPIAKQNTLSFKNVCFAFSDENILSKISFVARNGSINFLIGKSGAGKTTTIKLALKLLPMKSGEIIYNGTSLKNIKSSDLYEIVSFVPQEPILLNDTIRNNILMDREDTDGWLAHIINKSGLSDLINRLPQGLDTVCGERGLRMSGGERQRIAIARALFRKPVFLFLDEASSALDLETEIDILSTMRKLSEEITIIAITHRTNTITDLDQVIEVV
jgi:ATP-binding cassette, subfamily B, bacterial